MAPFDASDIPLPSSNGASGTNPGSSTKSTIKSDPDKDKPKRSTGSASKPVTGSATTTPTNKATKSQLPLKKSSEGPSNGPKGRQISVTKGKDSANKEGDKAIIKAGVAQRIPSTSSNSTQAPKTIAATKSETSSRPSTNRNNKENKLHNSSNTNDTNKSTKDTGSKTAESVSETSPEADGTNIAKGDRTASGTVGNSTDRATPSVSSVSDPVKSKTSESDGNNANSNQVTSHNEYDATTLDQQDGVQKDCQNERTDWDDAYKRGKDKIQKRIESDTPSIKKQTIKKTPGDRESKTLAMDFLDDFEEHGAAIKLGNSENDRERTIIHVPGNGTTQTIQAPNRNIDKSHQNASKDDPENLLQISKTDKFFKSLRASNGQSIYAVEADVCTLETDVIVRPSSTTLDSSTGAAKAIREAAGPEIEKACKEERKNKARLRVGDCFVTKGYNLPAKQVLHAAGPFWSEKVKPSKCKDDLKKTIQACIDGANNYGTSVAIPPIGAGGFKFPIGVVAEIVAQVVGTFCTENENSNLKEIIIVDINRPVLEEVYRELSRQKNIKITECLPQSFYKKYVKMEDLDVNNATVNRSSPNPPGGLPVSQTKKRNTAGKYEVSERAAVSDGPTTDTSHADIHGDDKASGGTPGTKSAPLQDPDTVPPAKGDVKKPSQQTASCAPVSKPHDPMSGERSEIEQVNGARRADGGASVTSSGSREPEKPSVRTRRLLKPADDREKLLTLVGDPSEQCSICIDTPEKAVSLPCGHVFCKDCIITWLDSQPTCPCCGKAYGVMKGNQPEGEMHFKELASKLPGHEGADGTIEITYHFPNGTQSANHPKPGVPYRGKDSRAYLPNSPEGQEVLTLLRKAFDARLLFTVGKSVTTGRENTVTWNDVHHKTRMEGGPQRFGYPDPGYLSRVKEELAIKGIKSNPKSG